MFKLCFIRFKVQMEGVFFLRDDLDRRLSDNWGVNDMRRMCDYGRSWCSFWTGGFVMIRL